VKIIPVFNDPVRIMQIEVTSLVVIRVAHGFLLINENPNNFFILLPEKEIFEDRFYK